eukprot:g12459.t1
MPARSATPVPNLRQSYLPQPAQHVPCYHAQKLKQQMQVKQAQQVQQAQQAIRVMEPFRKVNGEWVDYWSEYHQCWIPACILDVDPESGGIVLDVKPGTALRLHDQWRVRPRRMPTPDQVSAVHKMLANVELEAQAERFFHEIGRVKTDVIQRGEEVTSLGEKVNHFVGLLGCQVHLKVKFQAQNYLTFEDFRGLFWDIAHLQQDMSVHGDMEFLKQEIQNLIQLDHPHVLKLLEFYNSHDQVFLVTDHCSRGELHKHISCCLKSRVWMLPTSHCFQVWIAHVMQQVLSAITHIHANGIIHLDIKSQNIMLMPALETKAQFLQAEHSWSMARFHVPDRQMSSAVGVCSLRCSASKCHGTSSTVAASKRRKPFGMPSHGHAWFEWPPNEMPSFKGVFKEFDDEGTGMLQESILVRKFVSCGYDEQQAKRAAAAMNLSQNKNAVDWTEFVAACIDLGNPKIEPCIQMIFHNADKESSPSDVTRVQCAVRAIAMPKRLRKPFSCKLLVERQRREVSEWTGTRSLLIFGGKPDLACQMSHLQWRRFATRPSAGAPRTPDILANVTDALRATADEWISSLNSVGQNWSLKEMGYGEDAINAKVLQWCRQYSLADLQQDDRFYIELDKQYAKHRAALDAKDAKAAAAGGYPMKGPVGA